jgi:hypothetical protein
MRLRKHVKSVHDNIKDLKCDLCPFVTGERGHLNLHFRAVHARIKRNKCGECSFAAAQKGSLDAHIKTVHNKIRDIREEIRQIVSQYFSLTVLKGRLHVRIPIRFGAHPISHTIRIGAYFKLDTI